jgi:hypothetical protein
MIRNLKLLDVVRGTVSCRKTTAGHICLRERLCLFQCHIYRAANEILATAYRKSASVPAMVKPGTGTLGEQ